MNLARLSPLGIGRLYATPAPQEISLVFISVRGHSAAEENNTVKNLNDLIDNRTRKLPSYSALPQRIVW